MNMYTIIPVALLFPVYIKTLTRLSESVNRRRDNTIANENGQKDKQQSKKQYMEN